MSLRLPVSPSVRPPARRPARPPDRPSARNNPAPNGRIFKKFHILGFLENLSKNQVSLKSDTKKKKF
jgi:hypothetical protein